MLLAGSLFNRNIPTSSTLYLALFDINLMISPGLMVPVKTLQLTIVPLKES